MKKLIFGILCLSFCLVSCSKNPEVIKVNAADFYKTIDCVTKTMVHDIFSPPVASRVYMYPNIAAYEIIAASNSEFQSLTGQIEHLSSIPKATDTLINSKVSAIIAHIEVSKTLIFTKDLLIKHQDSLYTSWKQINSNQFKASKLYGEKVANHILIWMSNDHYKETRTMPKFNINSEDPSRWQPTPPAYMNGIEPSWNKMRTTVLDSASQFKPKSHPKFSLEKTSEFYTELQEVYDITNDISSNENSEEVKIAQFWDCNPYVSYSTGHLMTATKKISPGAHWIGITQIACEKSDFDLESSIFAFTLTSIGLYDAFISCWDEKYRSNLIRPETLINQHLDNDWKPLLQTPPFPEYTSGHSVVSGTASIILTAIFGDDYNFIDTTELDYGLPTRTFTSFNHAAEEAAISRLYGGIHYRAAINNGLVQGREVGKYIIMNVSLK